MQTHFFGQYLFVCIIKSTHQLDVPGTKTWDLEANIVPWVAVLVLGRRQKWVNLPITFFQLFMSFLVDFYILYNIWKIWNTFFPFRQIITNFHFHLGQKWKILTLTIKQKSFIFINVQITFYPLSQNFSFLTIMKFKIGYKLPKQKNSIPNFLYVVK